MICINCFHKKTNVTNSRPHKKTAQIWRRRSCVKCQQAFTTYERPALHEEFTVVDSKGGEKMYNPGRLFVDIFNSLDSNSQQRYDDAFWLTRSIEDMIIGQTSPISTTSLKEATHAAVSQFDSLAGIQYAARHRLQNKLPRRGRPQAKQRS